MIRAHGSYLSPQPRVYYSVFQPFWNVPGVAQYRPRAHACALFVGVKDFQNVGRQGYAIGMAPGRVQGFHASSIK